ncbi:MAG: amidohydrolase [Bacillota bacterium]|nr:amidohydrolase [Eubacteriales bacterium]MDD4286270.1 amidohydrolase [Eubacteriales bacterium]MDI9492576.1 amidohydrolase [Bacillota bacterium]NLV69462.1 amidohydrolase [Clostridiales bacterium]HPF18492.1 amidohydrolase [Bacillota bacterium]
MKRLLKNCDILAGSPAEGKVIRNGYLGIDGPTITYIGAEMPTDGYDEAKDMKGCLLIPGLVNCHCHAPMVLLRGVGSDLPLQEWLFGKIMPVEANLNEEDIVAGSQLAILEMLACGITSFTDMYYYPDQTAQVVIDSGIKANLCLPLTCQDPEMKGEDCQRITDAMAFYKAFNGKADARLLVDFGIHSEYLTTPRTVEYFSALCRQEGGRIHLHLSETLREHKECKERYGKTPTEWFRDLGTLDSPVLAAHCVHCEDTDLDILAEKKTSFIHNPSSNMKLGSGFAPVVKALQKGVNVVLGTDGAASNNNLNMLEEMHLAAVIHNGYHRDATVVPPGAVIRMATTAGAKAQGRSDTGELMVGNKADIAAVSFDAPHMYPAPDILPMLTYAVQAGDVQTTIVDGNILYDNSSYLTLDAEQVRYHVGRSVRRLLG